MKTGSDNLFVATLIFQECIRLGIKDVCIAPGSRSTALVLAAVRQKQLRCHTHIDERGLGFFALNLSKTTATPVVIITTSGTAVANLLPAVIEAKKSHIPLLILTADRPPELLETGANQTILQQHIFSHYPVESIQWPCPDDTVPSEFWLSSIDFAVASARYNRGPVHINAPFREPLFSTDPISSITGSAAPFHDYQPWSQECHHLLKSFKNPVIFLGQLSKNEADSLKSLLNQYPTLLIFSDISSQIRCKHHLHPSVLNTTHLDSCDVVLHFGGPFVSKILQQAVSRYAVSRSYIHFQTVFEMNNPSFLPGLTLFGDTVLDDFYIKRWADNNLHASCHKAGADAFESLKQTWILDPSRKEWHFLHVLSGCLPQTGYLFLSNSLPVRIMHDVLEETTLQIVVNRGASGIDGILSSVAGVAYTDEEPVVAVVGDMAFLHDLNALSLFSELKKPVIVIVMNNKGGQIFSTLPVSSQPELGSYFVLEHQHTFKQAVEQFKLNYTSVTHVSALKQTIETALTEHRTTVIEVLI